MLKKYKNQIFNSIIASDLPISSFEIADNFIDDYNATIVKFINSPFEFIMINPEEDYHSFRYKYTLFGPAYPMTSFYPDYNGWIDFEEVLNCFNEWLKEILPEYLEETKHPDLWEEYKSGNKLLNLEKIDFEDQINFSLDEQKQIHLSINELKHLIISKFELSSQEGVLVNERLEYLLEASARLNKFDWKSLAISAMISITITLSLDTHKGQILYDLFMQVFQVIPKLAGAE